MIFTMSETIDKSTTEVSVEKVELFQTLSKSMDGKYIAVLSDDSMDRDGEIVSRKALEKVCGDKKGKTAILLDHENKIENLIGEWTNKRIEDIDGHSALVAEPKFYLSNPKAQAIKGLLDDGAHCGISIGAIVKDRETQKINGKATNVYTDLELVEASFVAIPSNRHGAAMAMAKKFEKKLTEETQMTEEKTYTEKEYDELSEKNAALEQELVKAKEQLEELTKSEEVVVEEEKVEEPIVEEPAEEVVEESKEADVTADLVKDVESLKEANIKLQEELEKVKKSPVLKAQHDTPEDGVDKVTKKEGQIPVLYR